MFSPLSIMFVIRFQSGRASEPQICSATHGHDQSSYINTLQFLRAFYIR
jgi:hypothetical protein